ncbi:MAG TPA: GH3 auxin-responsive promoter family protein [bacterium]|nr:GH3 auxin-responsive promoter family protein [bacterium]
MENPLLAQERVFFYLIKRAKKTTWGKRYGYNEVSQKNFSQALKIWQANVPISSYEQLFADIDRTHQGEKNVLWPGKIKWFAKSSGTTNSKSKIIPITKEALKKCHYKGGEDVFALYIKQNSETKLFSGKTLSVGGSFSSRKNIFDLFYGDLSAILMNNLPIWARMFRAPKLSTALLGDWEKKVEVIARETINQNIVALAGVPSWNLVVLNKVLEITGKDNILEVWPNLELFLHGGVSFSPYKAQFEKIIPSNKMNYLENYNASEGFFAFNDDLSRDDMLLVLDSGVFYEFIPLEELNKSHPRALLVSEVEIDKTYALAISTNGGLWRYLIGDTVKITSLKPLRLKVAGRTKHFINVFGEELMVSNADEAIRYASEKTGAIVAEYTAGPVYMKGDQRGGHEWIIEFLVKPKDLNIFIDELDKTLKKLNSDYEAKRYNNLILDLPKIVIARENLFYDWLKIKNKLGGQNKVPRLANSRDFLDELLKIN